MIQFSFCCAVYLFGFTFLSVFHFQRDIAMCVACLSFYLSIKTSRKAALHGEHSTLIRNTTSNQPTTHCTTQTIVLARQLRLESIASKDTYLYVSIRHIPVPAAVDVDATLHQNSSLEFWNEF